MSNRVNMIYTREQRTQALNDLSRRCEQVIELAAVCDTFKGDSLSETTLTELLQALSIDAQRVISIFETTKYEASFQPSDLQPPTKAKRTSRFK